MINAREEFTEHVSGKEVLCAVVKSSHRRLEIPKLALKQGYSGEEYKTFLSSLDFDYDDGYGSQRLEGTIWFVDGTWSTRGEYDGSEWWQNHSRPEVPEELK